MNKTKDTKVKANPSDSRDPKKSQQRSPKIEAISKAFIEALKNAGDDQY